MSTDTKTRPRPKAKTTPKPQVRFLPVADLHVSKLNMRHGKQTPDIGDIYPSILESGIHQSLLVRKEGKGWGVIAGRRRLFALKKKAKETGKAVTAPCIIMQSGNIGAAREASLLENVARLPATQLERFAAYKALAETGKDTAAIAETFGIRELDVKRVLALANLKPELLALYESEEIRGATLQALTLATEEQQSAWLEVFHSDDYAPQGEQLKAWLTGGARIKTDVALFSLEDYAGTIITDLFGESAYFQDPDLFWTHQNKAIAEAIETWKAEGWNEIVVMERGEHFATWEHGKRTQGQGGKIFLAIGHDGSVTPHIGYLSNADIRKIDAILKTGSDSGDAPKSAKPEMSGPMVEYISLHRHAAIRASLLDHPMVALRLTVAHMLVGSNLWSVAPQKTTSRKDLTSESVANSQGAQRFAKEQKEVLESLGLQAAQAHYGPTKQLAEGDVAEVFAVLMETSDAQVMRALTLAMGMSLGAGETITEAVTLAIPVDMQTLWEPDDAFFDILRDKKVINEMVKEVAGKSCADGALTDTGKAQKEIIRNRMKGIGVSADKARPDWRPRWMQVAARHYLSAKTCPPSADRTVAAKLFAKTAPKQKAA
ncbi:ParB/RepB/Spo0J family partition protein [Hyphomonas sp.]|uniref:ParB/RepB/Spo0J family partition protein n=1 Tax=Hyphomonas sp. TaxID=87 RepID=UPI0025B8050D|nr:ParB/RepB/Spo0J family partition protein [Hyphomonas sp.]